MRAGRLLPVCLLLAAWGCREGRAPLRFEEALSEWNIRKAMLFEPADDERLTDLSLRVFLEERRPHFSTIKPEKVARTWERKLRSLDVSARRTDRIVSGRTPKGLEFELVFWTESSVDTQGKDLTVGELLWREPDEAGRGVAELLAVEQRYRAATTAKEQAQKKER